MNAKYFNIFVVIAVLSMLGQTSVYGMRLKILPIERLEERAIEPSSLDRASDMLDGLNEAIKEPWYKPVSGFMASLWRAGKATAANQSVLGYVGPVSVAAGGATALAVIWGRENLLKEAASQAASKMHKMYDWIKGLPKTAALVAQATSYLRAHSQEAFSLVVIGLVTKYFINKWAKRYKGSNKGKCYIAKERIGQVLGEMLIEKNSASHPVFYSFDFKKLEDAKNYAFSVFVDPVNQDNKLNYQLARLYKKFNDYAERLQNILNELSIIERDVQKSIKKDIQKNDVSDKQDLESLVRSIKSVARVMLDALVANMKIIRTYPALEEELQLLQAG